MILRRALPADTDLLALQRAGGTRYPLLLESVAGGNALSRWDLLLRGDGNGLRLDRDGETRRLDGSAVQGTFLVAVEPSRHGRVRHADTRADLGILQPVGRGEDDARALDDALLRCARADQALQLGAVPFAQLDDADCSCHTQQSNIGSREMHGIYVTLH